MGLLDVRPRYFIVLWTDDFGDRSAKYLLAPKAEELFIGIVHKAEALMSVHI
jgi:hypothetical protein